MIVRAAHAGDLEDLVALRGRLWPKASTDEDRAEVTAILAGHAASTLPVVLFVAEAEGWPIGFVEVRLRSHADGCYPSRPCGFLEGWYVAPEHRRRGVGRRRAAT